MSFLHTVGHYAPILQSRFDTQFIEQADSNTVILALIIVVVVVAILLIVNAANRRRAAGSGAASGKYRRGSFRRKGRQLGLSKAQITTLDSVREKYQVKNPMALLANSRQLDFYLNKTVRDLEEQVSTDEVKEGQKLTLYRIKQVIERNAQKSAAASSTKQLKTGQRISVSGEDNTRYPSRVVAILRDGIAVEVPSNGVGDEVRWKKWSAVVAHFWGSNGEGYSFQSKVTGYNTIKGVPSIFLQHTNRIIRAKQRRYRRKTIESPCYFYAVKIMALGTERNAQKKAMIDKKREMLGTIIEVSAGGCSIRANRILENGSLIKIDFETGRSSSVSSYGKVVGSRKESDIGSVMNIMFTRVSKKHLNRINSFIYKFGMTS